MLYSKTLTRLASGLLAAASFLSPCFTQADSYDINPQLEEIRQEHGVPALAAAVVKNGIIIRAGAVGTRVHGLDIPVTINDRFHIGSCTKAMTATLAGMMVDEGKLRWDSTIQEVLGHLVPDINPALGAVTLEQLLTQVSGIPADTEELMAEIYFSTDNHFMTNRELRIRALERFKDHVPTFLEGSEFQYANVNFLFAGLMTEEVAGIPWEHLIHIRLFQPLGLTTAGLGAQATEGLYDAAVGHALEDDGRIVPLPWGFSADLPSLLQPAGGAHLSILDFARWASWNAAGGTRGPQIISPETLNHIQTTAVPMPMDAEGIVGTAYYTLGWALFHLPYTSHYVLQHNGSNALNLARILVDTEEDLAVVVTTNFPRQPGENASRAAMELLYRQFSASGDHTQWLHLDYLDSWVYIESLPWLYVHARDEWVYLANNSSLTEPLFYHPQNGWWWTTSEIFPLAWSFTSQAWEILN